LDLAVRHEGDFVAHIELSCGDHCRDVVEAVGGAGHIAEFLAEDAGTVRPLARAQEITEGAPVPARRESPIAEEIGWFEEVKASFEVLLFPAASSAVGAYVVVLRCDT
jgi:hypothetical protein